VAVRAGKLMLDEIAALVERRASFAFETTLSGLAYSRHIPRWRAAGYRVELHFLSLATAEQAMDRVARRVRQGGHHIPEDVVRRRFASGMRCFEEIYKPLVDNWVLYDNTDNKAVIVDSGTHFGEPMTKERIATYGGLPPDAPEWLQGALRAMHRAAERARDDARRWGTELVYVDADRKVVLVHPDDAEAFWAKGQTAPR
jgi:predicted ABC-type ATPase